MKFGQKLASELTESWKENYIQYDLLKCMTNQSKSSDSDSSELEFDEAHLIGREKLIGTIRTEIKKVDNFYRSTENKIKEEIDQLEEMFEVLFLFL
jgi:SPX domain protein involved in polyphosphate accumulation